MLIQLQKLDKICVLQHAKKWFIAKLSVMCRQYTDLSLELGAVVHKRFIGQC